MADPFIDGELSATDRMGLRSHLETCGRCASAVVYTSALKRRLRDCVSSMEVPVWLCQDVQRRIGFEREDE
jgi:anti-sigma factor RsiW